MMPKERNILIWLRYRCFALGYNNKEYNDAVKAQVDKLVHTSNYFYNEPAAAASEKLVKATGLSKVFSQIAVQNQ